MSENENLPPPLPARKTPAFAFGLDADLPLAGSASQPPPLPAPGTGPRVPPLLPGAVSPEDFTVGWLVVIGGPGRGRSLPLRPGMNSLGRASANRLVLDFGDEGISAQAHTVFTYDPRGRKFYVQPGPDAVNLTYLGENGAQPVLMPTEITGGEIISLARTRLRFVPFCGPGFSWE